MEQTANIVSFPGLGWEFEIDSCLLYTSDAADE